MKQILRSIMIVLMAAALLAGCATLPAGVARGGTIAPQPLKLSIGYDLAFLRVSIKRAKHPELRFILMPDSKGVMRPYPEIVEVKTPYHHLVIDLGNGLTVDYNGNLNLDLLRLYHLDAAKGYSLTERIYGLFPSGASLVKKGDSFNIVGSGIWVERFSTQVFGNEVVLNGGLFHHNMKIVSGASSISYELTGRHDANTVTIRQPAPDKVDFTRYRHKTVFRLIDSNHLRSTDGLDLTRRDSQIDIVLHSPGGVVGSYVFERTHNGCTITQRDGYGVITVIRDGQTIYVEEDGSLSATVAINSLTK